MLKETLSIEEILKREQDEEVGEKTLSMKWLRSPRTFAICAVAPFLIYHSPSIRSLIVIEANSQLSSN